MTPHNNIFRIYRKRSSLTQSDMAALMGSTDDYSNISRWELGQRKPTIKLLLTYHLLFDVPVEDFFHTQKDTIRRELCAHIEILLYRLEQSESTPRVTARIGFLEATLKRLSAESDE